MSHSLALFVGREPTIGKLASRVPNSRLKPLTQGLFGVFLFAEDGESIWAVKILDLREGFDCLSQTLHDCAQELSAESPLAYLETLYHGGGSQQSVMFNEGSSETYRDDSGERSSWPINRVLRALGVVADSGLDEFDTVGLYRRRNEEFFE